MHIFLFFLEAMAVCNDLFLIIIKKLSKIIIVNVERFVLANPTVKVKPWEARHMFPGE